jgi:hypothetical protein
MAILKNTRTQESIHLRVQHTFGRQPETCATLLDQSDVSRLHAVIGWDGDHWLLKDSSSNGTYRNGKRQKPGINHRLQRHDLIQFGGTHADNWEVISLAPPQSQLIPVSDEGPTIELDLIAVLPSEDNPEVTLYKDDEGQWLCESPMGTVILHSGDLVGTQHQTWRFLDGKPTAKTSTNEPPKPPSNIQFEFDVSQNEEHVSLQLIVDNDTVHLGERSHHYLLLVLARQRLEDKRQGVANTEQGWLDKAVLMDMLGLEESHINIQIYRFRKQLVGIYPGAYILHNAIERRPGELRFASSALVIRGGMTLTTGAQRKHLT